jgi:hypothetical protein
MQFGTSDVTLVGTLPVLTPGLGQWLIVKATANNADTVARTVTVYRVPNGGTAGAGNILAQPISLAAGATVTLPLSGQALINGASLQAVASADHVVNLNLTYEIVA